MPKRKQVGSLRRKGKGYFAAAHAETWDQFLLGSLITGLFLGFGWALGNVIVRGAIQKYGTHHGHTDAPSTDILTLGLK